MYIFLLLVMFALTACSSGGRVRAAGEDLTSLSPAEELFAKRATQDHLFEIEMARLAQQKSGDQDVQKYADTLIKNRMSALVDLTDLVKDTNIPQEKTLAPETQQEVDRMSFLAGPDFDREFGNMMVSDHQRAIRMFREQSNSAENPDLKSYVDGVLQKLQKDLQRSQELQSRLFNGATP